MIATEVAAELRHLPLEALTHSLLNPRGSADDEGAAIPELAESIHAEGLQQNLLGREDATGRIEIFGGGRRLRALTHLASAGRWSAAVPVLVYPASLPDSQARVFALLENLQRRDMHWLDEAEAFAAVVAGSKRGDGATERLAAAVGRDRRSVQQYVAVAKNLVPALKNRCRADSMRIDEARRWAALPASIQERANALLEARQHVSPDRYSLVHALALVASERAIFDVEEAGLATFALGDGQRYFEDREAFLEAQRAALEQRVAQRVEAGEEVLAQESPTRWASAGEAVLGDSRCPTNLAPELDGCHRPVALVNLDPTSGEVLEGTWDPSRRAEAPRQLADRTERLSLLPPRNAPRRSNEQSSRTSGWRSRFRCSRTCARGKSA